MSKETVSIDVTLLTQQVNDGMKKKELAKHYGISVLQMTKALKEAGLKIRKFHHPAFKLVTADAAAPVVEEAKVEEGTDVKPEETTDEAATTTDLGADATPVGEAEAAAEVVEEGGEKNTPDSGDAIWKD